MIYVTRGFYLQFMFFKFDLYTNKVLSKFVSQTIKHEFSCFLGKIQLNNDIFPGIKIEYTISLMH